ncbi:MAG: hypothetical protein ACJ8F7_17175, partial [Gemmataceae bacterium]
RQKFWDLRHPVVSWFPTRAAYDSVLGSPAIAYFVRKGAKHEDVQRYVVDTVAAIHGFCWISCVTHPSHFSRPDDAWKTWEQEDALLLASWDSRHSLIQLLAAVGEEVPYDVAARQELGDEDLAAALPKIPGAAVPKPMPAAVSEESSLSPPDSHDEPGNDGITATPRKYTLGQLIEELRQHEECCRVNRQRADAHAAAGNTYAELYCSGVIGPWRSDPERMPGIGRFEAICNEKYGPLTYENAIRLRGEICRFRKCGAPEADALELSEAVMNLEGDILVMKLEGHELATSKAMKALLDIGARGPFTTLDRFPSLGIDIARADFKVVPGNHPTICPNADPSIPEEYVADVLIVAWRFPVLIPIPNGHTVHWIGRNGWERNLCKCQFQALPLLRSSAVETGDPKKPTPPTTASDPANGPDRAAILKGLAPAVRLAYLAFSYAESKKGRCLQDRDAYEFLTDEGIPDDAGDKGDLADYRLPAFDTWSRYLREARKALDEGKYSPRGGRRTGSSIARANQVESQRREAE